MDAPVELTAHARTIALNMIFSYVTKFMSILYNNIGEIVCQEKKHPRGAFNVVCIILDYTGAT